MRRAGRRSQKMYGRPMSQKKTNNVFPFDTKDDEGGERSMPFDPEVHLNHIGTPKES